MKPLLLGVLLLAATPTPSVVWPVPTLDTTRIQCTDRGPLTCCALWSGNRWGQGTWQALGCYPKTTTTP